MSRKAHIQPTWADTSLASVGALTIQAWQLDTVDEEERHRKAKKVKAEAKKNQIRGESSALSRLKLER